MILLNSGNIIVLYFLFKRSAHSAGPPRAKVQFKSDKNDSKTTRKCFKMVITWSQNANEKHIVLITHLQMYGRWMLAPSYILAHPRRSSYILAYPRRSSHILVYPRSSSYILADPRISSHILADPRISSQILVYPRTSSQILADPRIS